MTVIEISKKTVLKAIKEEPLKPGAWIVGTGKVENACSVCAVGGVLRQCLSDDTNKEDINDIAVESMDGFDPLYFVSSKDSKENVLRVAEETVKSNALAGLSQAFEGLCGLAAKRVDRDYTKLSRHQMYRIRGELASFVKKNFPAKVELDIGYATPAKGMKILRSK